MGNIEQRRALGDAFEEIGGLISEAGGQGDEAFDVIKDEIARLREQQREAAEDGRAYLRRALTAEYKLDVIAAALGESLDHLRGQ
jgi:hypothetical protein